MTNRALHAATVGLAALATAATPATAHAQDDAPASGVAFSAGAVARAGTSHLKEVDAQVVALPFLTIESAHFALTPEAATVRTQRWNGLQARAFATARMSEIEASDSAFFAGIDRDPAAELGGGLSYETEFGTFDLAFQGDVSGAHDGTALTLGYSYDVAFSKLMITPKIDVTRMSENLSAYAYGVSASEARADRPAYAIGATWSAGLGVDVARPLNENWTAFWSAESRFIDDETYDSPLVDDRVALGASIGVRYAF